MFDERNRRISVYRFLLFSQHLSKVITRVRWKIAQSIALMRESVTYPLRKLHNLSWLIISLNIYTIVTIQWILEITIPRF